MFFIVCYVCAHTLLLNSIIHFTFADEKQDAYQYMDKEFSNIRIVDIAKMAGVSVGTVDRVIHNRGRVSEENRKKVQAILEMVHYQPNLMARSLAASKKQYHLLAITPSFVQGEYWEAISEGIDKAASEMESYNITITKLFFDQYNNKTFDDIIRNLLNEKVDGVLIATLFTDSVIRLSQELDRNEIPLSLIHI